MRGYMNGGAGMRLVDADYLLQIAVPLGWSTPKWVSEIGIEDAPTIDAVPVVHGKWINISDEDWAGGGKTECCNCNYGYAWGAYFEVEDFKYCPHCGARMDNKRKDGADNAVD